MAAQDFAQNKARLSDWIPLDMKGKPMYAGVNETDRLSDVRNKINAVRVQWNDAKDCQKLVKCSRKRVEVRDIFSRSAVHVAYRS